MLEAAQRLGLRETVNWIQAKYPKNLAKRNSEFHEANCGSLVIGVVQWPVSYDQNHPTELGKYYQQLKDMALGL
jgi:hypothetical protein